MGLLNRTEEFLLSFDFHLTGLQLADGSKPRLTGL